MNPETNDSHIEQQLKDALDQRAAGLDGATLSRLRQARAQALEQPRHWWHGIAWPQAGVVAALASVTLIAVLVMRQPAPEMLPLDPSAEALEVATLEHDLELIEDMAFYSWLETQDIDGADSSLQGTAEEASLAG